MKIFYTLLILFMLLPLLTRGAVFSDNRRVQCVKISTFSREQTEGTSAFSQKCSALVDKLLGFSSQPKEYIDIVECETLSAPFGSNMLRLEFTQETTYHEMTFALMRMLLSRRSRELFGNGSQNREITQFLAAALAFRRIMETRASGGGVDWDYVPARGQFDGGFYPDAVKLITQPVACRNSSLFQTYAMHCSLLLCSLEMIPDARTELFRRLLEMEAFGRKADDSALFVIGTALPTGMTLQQWYEKKAPLACRQDKVLVEKYDVQARVKELEYLEAVNLNDASIEKVAIDDFPAALKDKSIDKAALFKRRKQFYTMRNEAAPLLKEALEMYGNAIGMLMDGNEAEFRRLLALARSSLPRNLKLQAEASRLLDEAEKSFVPFNQRYSQYMDVFGRYRVICDELIGMDLSCGEGRELTTP